MQQFQLRRADTKFEPIRHVVETPTPGPNEVLVRVHATSLNYRDVIFANGGLGDKAEGLVPLSDGAGEVESVGPDVTRVRVGDRVAGTFFQSWTRGKFLAAHHDSALGGALPGMLSEYVVLNEDGLVKIPGYLSYEEAACLPCAAVTVWQGLFVRGTIQPGETALTLGTGGASIFTLQLASAQGVKVIVTSSSDQKLEKARSLGAWQTVNYKTCPEWEKEVLRLTDGVGVDHVMETAGTETYQQSIKSLAAGGQLVQIGVLTGFDLRPNLFSLQVKNGTISGVYVGSREHFEELNRFLEIHQIHPVIDRVFPFEKAPAAYEYLASGSHFGKVVIKI
jgi:NADPH:quinone reductase-like Zn-dependent oxidoreductase